MNSFGSECVIGVVTTGKLHFFTLYIDLLDFVEFQRGLFAHLMAFWEPLGGPQRSENGPLMSTLQTLASWTIMWCLEQNLVLYKTSKGAKSAFTEV